MRPTTIRSSSGRCCHCLRCSSTVASAGADTWTRTSRTPLILATEMQPWIGPDSRAKWRSGPGNSSGDVSEGLLTVVHPRSAKRERTPRTRTRSARTR